MSCPHQYNEQGNVSVRPCVMGLCGVGVSGSREGVQLL